VWGAERTGEVGLGDANGLWWWIGSGRDWSYRCGESEVVQQSVGAEEAERGR
jgi:hypothetical protein